jgi:signal transduction histidine kinase
VEFDIAPTFMQTVVFGVACVIAALAAVMLLVRWRVRQLTERERLRFVDRMHERERIARELHDTLLQGTQGLVLTVQAAVTQMPADAPARQMLERALITADRVMIEGRDRIQDLRASGNAAQDLPSLLARVAKGLSTDREVRIEVTADGPTRPLTARVADEAHQIGREAMINACRHAAAKSIEVQVTYEGDAFRLRVQDNGRGFEVPGIVPEASTESGRHWGLAGMRERASAIGGRLEVWTRVGAGTTVELRVPADVAYADRPAPRWWYRLRRT